MKGQYAEEVADCTQAIRLNPRYTAAYANRGAAYVELGQYDKAIGDFTAATMLDSKSAVVFFDRGVTYGKLGRPTWRIRI